MNSEFRKRVLLPSLVPFGAFVFIGALVFGFSRLLLAVPKDGSVVLGVLMAGCILFGAGALSKGGKLKDTQRAALVLFSLLVIVGGVAAATSLHTREVEGHIPIRAELTAKNTQFDKTEFKLPANEPVAINFANDDPLPHNVAIYDTPALKTKLLNGEIFTGPARSRIYELEDGLPKAVYFFRCDVHPSMNGRVLVGGATAPPASPAPGATGPGPAPTSPSPSVAPTTGSSAVALVAKNTAFDKTSLTFPANRQVAVDFDNQDPGLLHNFALYTDSSGTTVLFRGEFVTGPAKTRYTFTAPGRGSYFFRCEAHPTQMTGTATVT